MDMVSEKLKDSDSEEASSSNDSTMESSQAMIKRTCADCGGTRTPLWRGGPAGPRSLCNACGIRLRKRKRALMGLPPFDQRSNRKHLKEEKNVSTTDIQKLKQISSSGRDENNNNNNSLSLQMRQASLGVEIGNLREEEEAAVLLMTMSCGFASVTTNTPTRVRNRSGVGQ